jgi:hypothetical protein
MYGSVSNVRQDEKFRGQSGLHLLADNFGGSGMNITSLRQTRQMQSVNITI